MEAHRLARARRRLRLPVLRHRRGAGVQRLRSQEGRLRRAQGQDGREGRRRQDPRGQADEPAAVVRPAVGASLVPRGASEDRREVRRQVDRAGEHRHERAVQARVVAAQRQHRPDQVGRVARRGRRQADARQRPPDHRRHDRRAGLRGRRGGRALPGSAAGRDLPAEGDARVRAVPGPRHLLLRVQRQEHHRRQAAPRDVARDRPPVDHRQHRTGRPAAGDRLHAQGHARLRCAQPEVAVAAAHGRHGAGEAADERGCEPEDQHHDLHE